MRRRAAGGIFAALAVLAICGAAPSGASGAQLRGVVLTPNFQVGPPHGSTVAQSDREIAAACALGSTVARVAMNWDQLEPYVGHLDPGYFTRVDRMIAGLARCGIPTELTILGSPCWATTDPRRAPPYCPPSGWRYPPRSATDFGDVVSWSLSRWGPSLAAIEVWNEPNSGLFWQGSAAQYATLVNEAVARAAAAGSPVPILAGALAGADTGYLSQLYAAGMRGQGGISMHPYTLCVRTAAFVSPVRASCRRTKAPKRRGRRSIFRRSLRNVHRTMLAAGDLGGLWLTEFGFPACPATPYCVQERTQARWIKASLHLAASLRFVRAAILFSVRDIGSTQNWGDHFGLLRRDFSPRPSYDAVQRLFRGGLARHQARKHHRRRSR